MTFEEADTVYRFAGESRATRHIVECEPLGEFVAEISAFEAQLGQETGDTYWIPIMKRLRRIRYDIAAVPLPFNHPALELRESARTLRHLTGTIDLIYPAQVATLRRLEHQIEELAQLDINPLGDGAAAVLAADRAADIRLLITRASFRSPVQEYLRARRHHAQIVSVTELAASARDGTLLVIGPAIWYPSFILLAPRASHITFVHYRWLRDNPPNAPVLPHALYSKVSRKVVRMSAVDERGLGSYLALDARDLLPPIDWYSIAGSATVSGAAVEDAEVVEAGLYLLADNRAVYLEAEAQCRAYIVDLDADDEQDRIRLESTVDVEPGMYVLLRSSGAGDYLQAFADQLLEDRAKPLRALQRSWKQALRERVLLSGLESAITKLRMLGAARASTGNVRYWMAEDSIKTFAFGDFLAIMKFIGRSDDARQIWAAMVAIDNAHRRAGYQIRKLLQSEVLGSDLAQLQQQGWMAFALPGADSGELTVFRVEARAPETFWVHRPRLRHPFTVERDLWHG
jgi:hypothetical protein